MGRADLIGNGKKHLVPSFQPAGTGNRRGETPPPRRRAAPRIAAPSHASRVRRRSGFSRTMSG